VTVANLGNRPQTVQNWSRKPDFIPGRLRRQSFSATFCAFDDQGRKWVDIGALKDDKVADGDEEEEENAEEA
jgi:hypothetical protein